MVMMKNISLILALLWVSFSAFGCHGDSSQNNPIEAKTYGIVSGDDGLLVCTSTKGTTWSQMVVPEDLSQASFSGVAISPGIPDGVVDKVWVVSSQPPAIMTSADEGKTWNVYDGELYDCIPHFIEAADTETAWISCNGGNSIQPLALKTVDGGENWIPQEAGPPLTENEIILEGLSVVSPQVAWMSGGYGPSTEYHGLVLRTIDGGETWESKVKGEGGDSQLPADLPYLGVAAISADEAWVVSAHNPQVGSSVYHTTDGGDTWILQAENLITSGTDLNDVRIVDNVLWVAGDMGNAFRSSNGGAIWHGFDTGASGYNMGIAALDGERAWAVSSGDGSAPGDIVSTVDSGKNWAKQSYPATSAHQALGDVAFATERLF